MIEWRTISGFPKYEVSEHGDVRRALKDIPRYKGRIKRGELIAMRGMKFGYDRCALQDANGRWWTVTKHHAIALGFCGPRPSVVHQALHWDDDPTHNHAINIRWGTPKDNRADAIRNGGVVKGENNPISKLTNVQAQEIRAKYKGRYKHPTLKELGVEYGVSLDLIHHVIHNKGSYKKR